MTSRKALFVGIGLAAFIAASITVILLTFTPGERRETPPPAQAASSDLATRLAIETAPAEAMTMTPTTAGYARVLDPVPLATLVSDLAVASSAASASSAEAERSRLLAAEDQIISTRVAQAAAAQAAADQATIRLLRNRLGLEWGPPLAQRSEPQLNALVDSIARGQTALVRIDSVPTLSSGQSVQIDLGRGRLASARVLGPARVSDPRLQAGGWLAIVTGPAAGTLSIGTTLPARASSGGSMDGVRVPESAVLRVEGRAWVFVRTTSGTFERRELQALAPIEGGLFSGSGVTAGEVIVTHGASALYTAQQAQG